MRLRLIALLSMMVWPGFGQAAETVPPGMAVTVVGEPKYVNRHYLVEVEGVPPERQVVYQTWCTGEIGLRVSGLGRGPYRVHLAYVEMAMSDPYRRVFDVLLNGRVVASEVCIYRAVGNHRPLTFDFTVTPEAGVITYAQRKSVPEADDPLFCLLQIYDEAGRLVVEESAHALRPADWDLRSYLDLTRVHQDQDLTSMHATPPWPGTYKLRASDTARLTAADVVGPDGIAYPNWTRVGLPAGLPTRANTISARDFGAVPDDEADDSAALQSAIAALEARPDGGVLFIPPGKYFLDRPIIVKGDGIVLRGAGAKLTRLVSRFSKQTESPEIHGLPPDGVIHPQNFYYVWLDPEGLTGVEVVLDGKPVTRLTRSGRWEDQIFFRFNGSDLVAAAGAGAGSRQLRVNAAYRDGTVRAMVHPVRLSAEPVPARRGYGSLAMIAFAGVGPVGERHRLVADGRRGDMSLTLAPGHGLVAGDRIILNAPSTPRWDALIRTALKGPQNRTNQYEIMRVDGGRLELAEALRLDFPVVDGSTVQQLQPQVHCGLENLGFEQAVRAKVHSVMFEYGWECWVRGVEIVRGGDKALYMPHNKRSEVRDTVFDRVWFNQGGSGYIGWEHSFDCLMENVTTYAMRHAPVLQWASSGNVIRRSVFHGSDAQWHAGWTNENLFEEVIVDSSQRDGSYGNGMWASPPEDRGHGPNGPRNVVYNCNITSGKAGLWLGGMNEAWLILHNRFVVGRGPAIVMKTASFDHIIADNVFVLLDPQPAAIYIGSTDCTGVELTGNRLHGPVTQLVGGPGGLAVDRDNRVMQSGDIHRPQPAVRSIYEWQQAHRVEIQAEQRRRAGGAGL